MSFAAQKWALTLTVGSSTAKAVLLALAYYADEDGCCWPSQETVAKDTEFTSRAVRSAIAKLEDLGLIRCEKRHRKDGSRASDTITLKVGSEPNRKEIPVGQPEGGSAPPERRSAPPEGRSGLEPSGNHQGTKGGRGAGERTRAAKPQPTATVQPLHDVRSRLDTEGVETVCEITGRNEFMARKLVSRFLRMAYDEAAIVLALIREAKARAEPDPSMWIEDQLRARILRSRQPVPLPGHRDTEATGLAAHLIDLENELLAEAAHGTGTDDSRASVPQLGGPVHRGESRGVAWASGAASEPSDALLRATGFGGHDSRASRALRRQKPPAA